MVGAVNEAPDGEVSDWLILENVNTFAKAWVNGYEVEKETKYKVRIKGVSESKNYLNLDVDNKWYFLASEYEVKGFETKFTRQQLEEAGFGEVFDNPMFEIKEVE